MQRKNSDESSQEPHVLLSLLEAVAATASVAPWAVAPIPSLGRVFIWDVRPDASGALMDTLASQDGEVESYRFIRIADDRRVIGVLVAPRAGESLSLEALAAQLRTRYHFSTASDPDDTDRPF